MNGCYYRVIVVYELEKQIEGTDYLLKRFEFLYDESVEEMVDNYED